MAVRFVRLKLALLSSAFRRGWRQALGLVVGGVVAVPVSLALFVALATVGRTTAVAGPVLVLAFSALTLGWAVVPLLAFGTDETLDPARLWLLPLRRRQLFAGLLTASAVGVAPVATLVVVSGAVAGFAPAGAGAVFVVAGAVAQFLLCLLASRTLATVLSARLRSRRGRDLTAMLILALSMGAAFLGQLPNLLRNVVDVDDPAGVLADAAGLVGWLPLAWPAQLIVAGAEGRLLAAVVWLLAVAGLLAGLGRWWMTALARAATAGEAGAGSSRDADLFPAVLRSAPRNRLTATVAKELRYIWRVPQLRVQWLLLPVAAVGLVASVWLVPAWSDPRAVFAVAALAALQAFFAVNSFGADRGAAWLLVATGGPDRSDLLGKNLATALLVAAFVVPVAVLLAALTGGWTHVPVAVGVSAATFGVVSGVGNVVSALAPHPLPDSPTNLWSGASGTGCAAVLVQVLAMLVAGVLLLLPMAGVGAAVLLRPGLVLPAVALALGWGVAVWWAGVRLAGRLVGQRGPELVDALSQSS